MVDESKINYSYNQSARRDKVKKYVARGFPAQKIADKLDVSLRTIQRDIDDLKEEIAEKLEEEPIEEILFEMDSQLESIKEEYWKMYHQTKQDTVRISALNNLRSILSDRVKILQRLGIIREEPEKLEIKGAMDLADIISEGKDE